MSCLSDFRRDRSLTDVKAGRLKKVPAIGNRGRGQNVSRRAGVEHWARADRTIVCCAQFDAKKI
jgi:hypothetical protein